MRKLVTRDLFSACRMLKKIGIKDEIEKIAKDSNNAADAWARGFDLLYNIFDIATEKKSECYIYDFLSDVFEVTADELANMEIGKFVDLCKQLAIENDLSGFFASLGKLMKSN